MAHKANPQILMAKSALVDAAMMHAAFRLCRSLHGDPKWEYRDDYRRFDDEGLFLQLLHCLLFYERVYVNSLCSCGDEVHSEVAEVIELIERHLRGVAVRIVYPGICLEEDSTWSRIAVHLMRQIDKSPEREELKTWRVPWAYQDDRHHQYGRLRGICDEENIPVELIPFAAYCLSGLVYSSVAFSRSCDVRDGGLVYAAAPGRIAALEQILSEKAMYSFYRQAGAYDQLSECIPLPRGGYDFGQLALEVPAHETSWVAQRINGRCPVDQLKEIGELRQQGWCADLRERWGRRVSVGAVVGAPNQVVKDSFIGGDLIMVVGAPRPPVNVKG